MYGFDIFYKEEKLMIMITEFIYFNGGDIGI